MKNRRGSKEAGAGRSRAARPERQTKGLLAPAVYPIEVGYLIDRMDERDKELAIDMLGKDLRLCSAAELLGTLAGIWSSRQVAQRLIPQRKELPPPDSWELKWQNNWRRMHSIGARRPANAFLRGTTWTLEATFVGPEAEMVKGMFADGLLAGNGNGGEPLAISLPSSEGLVALVYPTGASYGTDAVRLTADVVHTAQRKSP